MEIKKDLGTYIKYNRMIKGMTIDEMASRLGIASGTLRYYEKNQRNPSIKVLKKIALLLKLNFKTLLDLKIGE